MGTSGPRPLVATLLGLAVAALVWPAPAESAECAAKTLAVKITKPAQGEKIAVAGDSFKIRVEGVVTGPGGCSVKPLLGVYVVPLHLGESPGASNDFKVVNGQFGGHVVLFGKLGWWRLRAELGTQFVTGGDDSGAHGMTGAKDFVSFQVYKATAASQGPLTGITPPLPGAQAGQASGPVAALRREPLRLVSAQQRGAEAVLVLANPAGNAEAQDQPVELRLGGRAVGQARLGRLAAGQDRRLAVPFALPRGTTGPVDLEVWAVGVRLGAARVTPAPPTR